MQYFTVLEDNKDNRWQAELLFESLKLLNLENHFVIAICSSKDKLYRHQFPNVVHFENIGRNHNMPHFNKCYGLGTALQSGELKQPFVLLDPDMFLLREIPVANEGVTSQPHDWLSWDVVKDDLSGITNSSQWSNIGGVYQFNNVPGKLFEDLINYTYALYRKENKPINHLYGFIMAIMGNDIAVHKNPQYEMPLIQQSRQFDSYVVHYNKGFPPYFTKDKAYDNIEFSFNLPMPFKLILDAPSRNHPNLGLLQTLVQSWLDSNLNRVWDLI